MELDKRIEVINQVSRRVEVMMSKLDLVQSFEQNIAFLGTWERMMDCLHEATDDFSNDEIPHEDRSNALIAINRLNMIAIKMQSKWRDRDDGVFQ